MSARLVAGLQQCAHALRHHVHSFHLRQCFQRLTPSISYSGLLLNVLVEPQEVCVLKRHHELTIFIQPALDSVLAQQIRVLDMYGLAVHLSYNHEIRAQGSLTTASEEKTNF